MTVRLTNFFYQLSTTSIASVINMEYFGPFAVIQEVYGTSKQCLIRKSSFFETTVGIRVTKSSCIELRINHGINSTMFDLYVIPNTKTDKMTDDLQNDELVLLLADYKTKLIISGANGSILRALIQALYPKQNDKVTTKPATKTLTDKMKTVEVECPLRSDLLASQHNVLSPIANKQRSLVSQYDYLADDKENLHEKRQQRLYGGSPTAKRKPCISTQPSTIANSQPLCPLPRTTSSSSNTLNISSRNDCVVRNLSLDNEYKKVFEYTAQQQQLLSQCLSGENVCYTGGGGTGKSTLLKEIIASMTEKVGVANVFIMATTGLAACAIGGTTIHQFLGISATDEQASEEVWHALAQQASAKKTVAQRCQAAKVIVIDEISMLGPKLFELLGRILRTTRRSTKTMGGIQLICCGDFFQLPPIIQQQPLFATRTTFPTTQQTSSIAVKDMEDKTTKKRYCFQSSIWKEIFPVCYELHHIYRQQSDIQFQHILNDIRWGKWNDRIANALRECVNRPLKDNFGILPSRIFTHKRDVDSLNTKKLQELSGSIVSYRAQDVGESQFVTLLQKHCTAKEIVSLKIGAQVILVKTIDTNAGLVNGARGIIVRFIKETNFPVVRFIDGQEHTIMKDIFTITIGGKIVASRSQIPLELAWGISVHKSQGMTVDQAVLQLQHVFEFGQVYVALSRVKSLEGVCLTSMLTMQHIQADPIVKDFYQQQQSLQQRQSNSRK